ncbi:hypothetical protein BDF20DRAFT_882807 [Mycotypha africana]|uniref:uncharacterized protein n=1 Tax=Mycotypha africana TaxID=64632 RepID=UPI002300DA3D|nr:uncharacterized protein BDF20DRAFT_882807 [Mycotypha africana]KAI8973516.1 hypothetical protein BDF20DRAFT_882807 [Mycotypha africana]
MPEIHDDDYKIPYVDGPTAVDYSLHEKSQSAAPLIITGNGNMDNPKRSDIPLCENILPLKLQNNHSQVSVVSTSDSVCELRDDNDPKQPSTDTILALDEKIRYYVPTILPKKLTHCKVTKITNHSSAKDHMYELFVQLNNKTVGVYSGVLSKIDKGISTDIPVGEPLIFNDLQWPFTFNFIVTATPLKKKNIVRQAFTKINTWNHPPSYLKRNVKRIGTGKCMASPAAVIQKDHPQQNNTSHQLPIFGYAYLLFDSYRNDLLNGGECTLKIHQCVDRRRSRKLVDLELSVIFDEEEILPTITRPSSSSAAITTTDTITRLSEEENLFSFNERIQKETRQSLDTFHNSRMAKTYCQHGDYLTFYTRGTNSPVWIRYWVVLRGAYLVVYDFGYKDKRNPITIIPLVPLLAVSQSSLDDCEEFGLMRSKCFTLNFNRASVVVNKPHHPTTFTDCKAFVKCDDERSSAYWRSAISTQLKDLPNDIKSKEGIEAAFLW